MNGNAEDSQSIYLSYNIVLAQCGAGIVDWHNEWLFCGQQTEMNTSIQIRIYSFHCNSKRMKELILWLRAFKCASPCPRWSALQLQFDFLNYKIIHNTKWLANANEKSLISYCVVYSTKFDYLARTPDDLSQARHTHSHAQRIFKIDLLNEFVFITHLFDSSFFFNGLCWSYTHSHTVLLLF